MTFDVPTAASFDGGNGERWGASTSCVPPGPSTPVRSCRSTPVRSCRRPGRQPRCDPISVNPGAILSDPGAILSDPVAGLLVPENRGGGAMGTIDSMVMRAGEC